MNENENESRKDNEGRKKSTAAVFWRILSVIAAIGCIVCLVIIFRYLWDRYKTQKEYEDLASQVIRENIPPAESSVPESDSTLPTQESAPLSTHSINFEELWEINPEIYAWIQVPGTKIDYPIAQREGEDQDYYLTHTIYGEVQTAASLYTEKLNKKDFTDPNTVIYGHNMKNGSMFHDLRYYAAKDYFDEHSTIYIYLPDKILTYQVFASYQYDDRHLLYSFDFEDEDVFTKYLDSVRNPRSMTGACVDKELEITAKDRIITLSTCVANKPEARRLVQAILVKEEEAQYGEQTESTAAQ